MILRHWKSAFLALVLTLIVRLLSRFTQSSEIPPTKYAYFTLLQLDGRNYWGEALTMIHDLALENKNDVNVILTMHEKDEKLVRQVTKCLQVAGASRVFYRPILQPDAIPVAKWKATLTKLYVWDFEEYEAALFLDCDRMIVPGSSLDHLFDEITDPTNSHLEFWGTKQCSPPACCHNPLKPYGEDKLYCSIETSFFALKPSQRIFKDMLAFIDFHKDPIEGSGDDLIDTIKLSSDGDVLHWYFLKMKQFAYLDYGYNVRGLGWDGAPWNNKKYLWSDTENPPSGIYTIHEKFVNQYENITGWGLEEVYPEVFNRWKGNWDQLRTHIITQEPACPF